MHITHALSHLLPGRWRLAAAALAVACFLTLALAIGGTATASAAGPATIGPGADVIFPTWFWGSTTVCADNLGDTAGYVKVDPWPYGDGSHNWIYAPAHGRGCTSGWWWGNPVKVTNHGSTQMSVFSY
jgi:hypothetical protein